MTDVGLIFILAFLAYIFWGLWWTQRKKNKELEEDHNKELRIVKSDFLASKKQSKKK